MVTDILHRCLNRTAVKSTPHTPRVDIPVLIELVDRLLGEGQLRSFLEGQGELERQPKYFDRDNPGMIVTWATAPATANRGGSWWYSRGGSRSGSWNGWHGWSWCSSWSDSWAWLRNGSLGEEIVGLGGTTTGLPTRSPFGTAAGSNLLHIMEWRRKFATPCHDQQDGGQ